MRTYGAASAAVEQVSFAEGAGPSPQVAGGGGAAGPLPARSTAERAFGRSAVRFFKELVRHVAGQGKDGGPGDPYDGLRRAARSLLLKGREAQAVAILAGYGGRVRVDVLAGRLGWRNPSDNWNSTRQRLNRKFRGRGWRFATHDRHAVAQPVPAAGRK